MWDATSGQLEKSEGVYSAGRSIITKSGVQCEADEEAKMFEETLNSKFFFESHTRYINLRKLKIFLGSAPFKLRQLALR